MAIDEAHWVIQIGQLLENVTLQTAIETPTSIFKLPDSLTKDNPEAYFPSRVALGPYHHFKLELYKMELYKLENVNKAREIYQHPEFNQILNELKPLEVRIRAFFDRYLDIGAEALATIMVMDGLFLVQLLAISFEEKDEMRRHYQSLPSPFPLFVEQTLYRYLIDGNLMTQNEIVKDLLMLENQIPLLVLKTLLPQEFKNKLHLLFFKFCLFVSPTRLPDRDIPELMDLTCYTNLTEILEESHHLLHFLYLLIMDFDSLPNEPVGMAFFGASFFIDLLNILAAVLQIAFLQQLNEAVGLIQSLFSLLGRVKKSESATAAADRPPFMPTASELDNVGVKLQGFHYDFLQSFEFKQFPSISLQLPSITINAFSEVVFRNLVAFEAEAKLKPPYFSVYVTMMSGLMPTAKDVKIVQKANIIEFETNSGNEDEEEVVKLFNGLRKMVEFYKQIDPVKIQLVKKINEYYESCWKVKVKRFIKRYIHPVLKVFLILIVIFLIGVVVVRTFCGWFGCSKIFHGIISS